MSNKINKRKEGKKLKQVMRHDCHLPAEEDILVRYIDSGYFVDMRRRFRKLLMVSELNPRSKIYLKSTFAIRREKETHLQDHYHMIHPFSQIRFYWEICMIMVLLIILTLIPIQLCRKTIHPIAVFVRLTFDLLCIVDICITFNTGYQHSNTKKVIMDRKMVAKNYVLTWFLLDFITCLNADILFLKGEEANFWYWKIPTALKILRIITLLKYMNRYRDFKQYSLYKFKMIKMTLVVVLLLLWTTCFLFIFARDLDEGWLPQDDYEEKTSFRLLVCFYQITNFFFLVTNSETRDLKVLVFEMVCLTIGLILQLFFYAQLLQAVAKCNTSSNKYHEMVQQLYDYMNYKNLPERMIKRVIQYFDFRFQKNYFKEDEIVGTLSQKLLEEINIHSCHRLIENVDIFKGLPPSIILKLTTSMKTEIFLPNDIIVKSGSVGDCMYFISSGTVAIYTALGREVCHLTDGSNFGEVCLVMEHASRVGTVVAVDYCDLFTLSRKDFNAIVQPYHHLYERTKNVAHARMKAIIISEHRQHKTDEYYDFNTSEGVVDFRTRLYEL